jgi:hypothetical protein
MANAIANITEGTDRLPAVPKVISPGQHAVLDYGVASFHLGLAAKHRNENRAAAGLAAANGLMVLGLAPWRKDELVIRDS